MEIESVHRVKFVGGSEIMSMERTGQSLFEKLKHEPRARRVLDKDKSLNPDPHIERRNSLALNC